MNAQCMLAVRTECCLLVVKSRKKRRDGQITRLVPIRQAARAEALR